MEALFAFGGIVLGWVLGAGTQLWRDHRHARIALTLIHNEIVGNIAQLELARNEDADLEPRRPSHWYKRWKLSHTAWNQQGAIAMLRLDGNDAWTVHEAYHALDAADVLLQQAREGIIALGEAVGNLGDRSVAENNPGPAADFAAFDAECRERIGTQLSVLHAAHALLDRHLGLDDRPHQ